MKPVDQKELEAIHEGLKLVQYLFGLRRRGKLRGISVAKIHLSKGKVARLEVSLSTTYEFWKVELRKNGTRWMPFDFYMWAIS